VLLVTAFLSWLIQASIGQLKYLIGLDLDLSNVHPGGCGLNSNHNDAAPVDPQNAQENSFSSPVLW
jgi:hypothetical protein